MKIFLNTPLSHKKSFTLTEIIIVIVTMGIFVLLAIPRFDVYYEIKLQAATKKVMSDVRYIQNIAISRHANTRIVFATTKTYQAATCQSACSIEANWTSLPDPLTRESLTVDFDVSQYSGVEISNADLAGTNTLRFNWQGVPQDGNGAALTSSGTIVLTLQGRNQALEVIPQTGKVNIL